MAKLLIIVALLVVLLYLAVRTISKYKYNNYATRINEQKIFEVNIPSFMLQQLLKKNLITVGVGFFMLIIILFLGSKFKIILILLPLSFYLIGQFFVFNNHVKSIKNSKITFNTINNLLTIESLNKKPISIDLTTKELSLKEVKSVQKNNDLLFGYFELTYQKEKYYISYLLAENLQNKVFFVKLRQISRNTESKLFPII